MAIDVISGIHGAMGLTAAYAQSTDTVACDHDQPLRIPERCGHGALIFDTPTKNDPALLQEPLRDLHLADISCTHAGAGRSDYLVELADLSLQPAPPTPEPAGAIRRSRRHRRSR
jgi:hypothetical protein